MNPSTDDLVKAAESLNTKNIIILPNGCGQRIVETPSFPGDARSFVVGHSLQTLAYAKQLMVRGAEGTALDAHLAESLAMYYASVGDGKEGVAAFNEKREPDFTGLASTTRRIFPS